MLPPSLATPEVDTLLELSKSMVKYHWNKTSTKEMQKNAKKKIMCQRLMQIMQINPHSFWMQNTTLLVNSSGGSPRGPSLYSNVMQCDAMWCNVRWFPTFEINHHLRNSNDPSKRNCRMDAFSGWDRCHPTAAPYPSALCGGRTSDGTPQWCHRLQRAWRRRRK